MLAIAGMVSLLLTIRAWLNKKAGKAKQKVLLPCLSSILLTLGFFMTFLNGDEKTFCKDEARLSRFQHADQHRGPAKHETPHTCRASKCCAAT